MQLSRIVARGDEPEYLGVMLEQLRQDDVLYDVGANIGLVALHAARKCHTVAFEPDPSFLARLRRNLELNPSISVDVQPIAVSDADGVATLLEQNGAGGHSPSLVHHGEEGVVEVRAQTLDSLVAGGTLPPPTVIKLDIEGAEVLALRGGHQVLRSPAGPPRIFLEVHDSFLPSFGSSAEEVLELVRACGYETVRYEARRADQQHLILERI